MNRRFLVVLFIFVVLLVLLGACAPAPQPKDTTQAETMLEVVFDRVNNGSLEAWSGAITWVPLLWGFFWFLLAGIVVTVIAMAALSEKGIGCVVGVVAGLIIGAIALSVVSSNMAGKIPPLVEKQAIHAMNAGVEQAKEIKANQYIEELHVPVISADIIYEDCRTTINSRSNCAPYEWTHEVNPHKCMCSDITDSKGNVIGESCSTCYDTEHVPYFTKQCQYRINVRMMEKLATLETGLKPDPREQGIPYRLLSDRWMVPQDYEKYWHDGWNRTKVNPADVTPPVDWVRYAQMLKQGLVPLVNVYHRYMNWIFTADAKMYQMYPGDIAAYEAAGLLPTMNTIYSRIGQGWAADYDFVQFVGGLKVDKGTNLAWQDLMYSYSAYFANTRQGSIVLVFAKKEPVLALGSVDKWVDTIKANYSQRGKWDITIGTEKLQRLLPKNFFILACVVDEATQTVPADGCRLRTGMPRGNEQITETFFSGQNQPEMKNVPFTPVGFFGGVWVELTKKGGSILSDVKLNYDKTKPIGLLLRDDPNGLRRVSMDEFEYLKADVQLDKTDMDNLVAREVAVQASAAFEDMKLAIIAAGLLTVCVVGLLVAGASQSSS